MRTRALAIALSGMFVVPIQAMCNELISQSVNTDEACLALSFRKQNVILTTAYKENKKTFDALDRLMQDRQNEIRSGKAHLAIIANILPADFNDTKAINCASVQANVVRSYIKQHYSLDSRCSTFAFDTTRQVNDEIRIEFIDKPLSAQENQTIFYALRKDTYSIDNSVKRYGVLPMKGTRIGMKVDKAEAPKAKRRVVIIERTEPATSTTNSPKKELKQSQTEDKETDNAPIDSLAPFSERVKRSIVHPIIAIKTNLLYWGGITAEKKYHYQTPNIQLEYFFAKQWSINMDAALVSNLSSLKTTLNDKSTLTEDAYRESWNFSSIGLEGRYWLSVNSVKTQFYGGIYGLCGHLDVQPKMAKIKGMGYNGSYQETGVSLGYYLPLTPKVGVEAGLRLGYRWVDAHTYLPNKSPIPDFEYQGCFDKSGLKVTALMLQVSYRFGK